MKFIQPAWDAPSTIRAYTTLRESWGERAQGKIQSITPDDETQLRALLHLPSRPIWLTQIHGIDIVEATPEQIFATADGSFTYMPQRVCVVLTADCLPILLCDKAGNWVAAVHAGWRGLANGIIEATFSKLNHAPENTLAWLGPAIGPQHFVVGTDVYDAFTMQHAKSASAFKAHMPGKWLANLYALAKMRLNKLGITAISGGEFCTFSQPDLFFSYRRDKTGRMASLIWIDKK